MSQGEIYLLLCVISSLIYSIGFDSEYTKGMGGQKIFRNRDQRLFDAAGRAVGGFVGMPIFLLIVVFCLCIGIISLPFRFIIK